MVNAVFDLVQSMPASWLTSVEIIRNGEKDWQGDVGESTSMTSTPWLVGPRLSDDPLDRSDVPKTEIVGYGPARSDVQGGDTLVVPPEHWCAGRYLVVGRPARWPLGVEVALEQVAS